jgi:hypothetical protein
MFVLDKMDILQETVFSMEKRMSDMESTLIRVIDAFRLANDATPSPRTPPGTSSPYALTPGKGVPVNIDRHARENNEANGYEENDDEEKVMENIYSVLFDRMSLGKR